MPHGTFFETEDDTLTAFSFVVYINDAQWRMVANGTLPAIFPATVVEAPQGGAAKILYGVLKAGGLDLGPVRIATPGIDFEEPSEASVLLTDGDVVSVQILGRAPEGGF